MTPTMSHVVCERERTFFGPVWNVRPIWLDVDRPNAHGFFVASATLAARLTQAIEAGVVYANPRVAVDTEGNTYVAFDLKVIGRDMDWCLKRLSF